MTTDDLCKFMLFITIIASCICHIALTIYVHDYLLLFMIPFRLMKYRLSLYRLKIKFQSLNLVEFRARIGNSLKSIKILHFLYLYFLCYGYIVCKRYLFEMYHWINMHETLFILSLISMTLFQYTLRLEFYFS